MYTLVKWNNNCSGIYDKCGVYRITIGKCTYIGSTKRNILIRIKEHESLLKRNKHYNHKLQAQYNIYQSITIDVLEYCEPKIVCKKEQYYINKYIPDMNIIKNVAAY